MRNVLLANRQTNSLDLDPRLTASLGRLRVSFDTAPLRISICSHDSCTSFCDDIDLRLHLCVLPADQSKTSAMQKGSRYASCRSTVDKQPLKRFTIAITGYFGEQRSLEQIRKWIHVNGGTVAHDVSSQVTHLVCSKKHFKKDVAMGTAPWAPKSG